MKTISIVNIKGGVGKTTVAMLLAATLQDAGKSVSVDDRDPQKSATILASRLNITIGRGGEIVIIDTAPRNDHLQTLQAIDESDICLLIATPNPIDLATTQDTARLIESRRRGKPTRLLLNSSRKTRLGTAAPDVLKTLSFPALKASLARREVYALAMLHGWSILSNEARNELQRLTIDILSL